MVSYGKLWTLLEERGLSQRILSENGISSRVMDSLRHNGNLEVITLVKICDILNCQFGDIMENLPADQVKDKAPNRNKGGRPRKKTEQ